MKVLIGVCGVGFGHTLRQVVVLETLLTKGHSVYLFCFGNSKEFFALNYPNISHSCVAVPWVYSGPRGVDYKATADAAQNRLDDGVRQNFAAMDAAYNYFGGPPDLVISDYEPVSAQFAYAAGKPLITLDQQSRFLGFDTPPIGTATRMEEKGRLRFFFPQAAYRISTSVIPITYPRDPEFRVVIVPPLIRSSFQGDRLHKSKHRKPKLILCYLPASEHLTQSPTEILSELHDVESYHFLIYSRAFATHMVSRNITVRKVGAPTFGADLKMAEAVICSAGHQLLSECVSLCIPTYVVPLPLYEQQFNAHTLSANGLCAWHTRISSKNIIEFVANQQTFRDNLASFTHSRESVSGIDAVMRILSDLIEDAPNGTFYPNHVLTDTLQTTFR